VPANSHSAITPTGTLMKKISRQSIRVSTPPRTGPDDDATAPPIAQIPTARARARGSLYACRIRAIDAGVIAAAAAPCTNRAATSRPRVGARPHATEASTNNTMPPPKARLAPSRSDSDPAVSSRAANIRVYPSTTHCSLATPPPRSCRMVGRVTLTTTASRVMVKKPSSAAIKVGIACRFRSAAPTSRVEAWVIT
jgi:hypothetical protein